MIIKMNQFNFCLPSSPGFKFGVRYKFSSFSIERPIGNLFLNAK